MTITEVFINEDRARIAVVIDDDTIVVYDVTDASAGREITTVTDDWVSMFGADPGVPVRDGIGPLPVPEGVDLPGWLQPRRISRRGGVTLDREYLEQCAGRELTDAEVARIQAALPHSTFPEIISTMVAEFRA